jgi:hypothetical protein
MPGTKRPRRKAQRENTRRVGRTVHPLDGMAVLYGRRKEAIAAASAAQARTAQLARPLNEEERRAVAMHFNASIQAIVSGSGTPAHYDNLMYGVHVGIVLAERGFGQNCLHDFYCAMEGLARMNERYTQRQIMGFDGEGLRAIRAINDLHDQQLAVATQGEIKSAIEEVRRRVQDVVAEMTVDQAAA